MARNLRTVFQQAMRRFFPLGRQKKDDDDFVLEGSEGRGVQPIGRRYKARREASKKALDSFQDMLSDQDDTSDHKVIYRPVGSGALRNQSRSFQGYVAGRSSATPSTSLARMVTSGGKQMIMVSQSTEVVHKPGSGLIEVRTIQPATPGGSKPGVPQKVLVQRPPGASAAGTLTAILNSPAGEGQKLRCIIPSSMVSLLKDRNKQGEEAGGGRALYVSISRPLESQPTVTVTGSSSLAGGSNLTSVLSTIHQSGGTVKVGKTAEVVGGTPVGGKSLLKNTILQSPALSASVAGSGSPVAGGTPLVVGGKSLIAVPGKRQVILAAGNQIVGVGGGSSAAGNIQLVAGNSLPVVAGSSSSVLVGNGPSAAASTTAAAVSSKSEDPKPVPNSLHISKETYLRLLSENKIRIVQQVPGGKPVIHLQPGVQLVQRTAVPSQSTGAAATTAVATPSQGVPGTVAPTASAGGSAPVFLSMGSQAQGSPRSLIIAAAPRASLVKKPVVVNPWSVSDGVVASGSSPLSVNSVLGVAQSVVSASLSPVVPRSVTSILSSSALPASNLSSIIAPVATQKVSTIVTSGMGNLPLSAALPHSVSSIAPVNVTQTVTTAMASVMNSPILSCSRVVTTSATQTSSTVIPVVASPICSVSVSPVGQVLMSVSSPLHHGTVTHGKTIMGSLKASPEVVMSPRQTVYSPVSLSQTSPVSAAPQMIVLSSAAGLSSAQRSLFTSRNAATGGASCSAQAVLQTVSSSGPSLVTTACDSQSAPVTVASLLPSASVNMGQAPSVISLQNKPAVVSPKTVSTVSCVMSPVISTVSAGSSVAKTSVSVPTVQTVNQPVGVQGSICSSSVAPGISQNVQNTSPNEDFISAKSVTVCENLCGSSSSQGQVSVSAPIPVTVTQAAHSSMSSSTPVKRKKTNAPSLLKPKTVTTLRREESPPCQSSVKDSDHDQTQSLTKDCDDQAVQGRSRRNVVSRDYKVFAGFSSKSGSGNRRSSTSKPAARTAEMDSPCSKLGQTTDGGKASKPSSLKCPAVDGCDQPQAKVMCMSLSPSVVLNDCSLGMMQARQHGGGQSPAVSICGPQSAVTGQTGPQASAGLKEAAMVPCIIQKASGIAVHRQEPAPQSSHHSLLSDQENVNSDEHCMENNSSAGDVEHMEVDSVLTSPQPEHPNSSPVAKSCSKSPLKHADRNIFQQFAADVTVSSAEKSPRDASVSE